MSSFRVWGAGSARAWPAMTVSLIVNIYFPLLARAATANHLEPRGRLFPRGEAVCTPCGRHAEAADGEEAGRKRKDEAKIYPFLQARHFAPRSAFPLPHLRLRSPARSRRRPVVERQSITNSLEEKLTREEQHSPIKETSKRGELTWRLYSRTFLIDIHHTSTRPHEHPTPQTHQFYPSTTTSKVLPSRPLLSFSVAPPPHLYSRFSPRSLNPTHTHAVSSPTSYEPYPSPTQFFPPFSIAPSSSSNPILPSHPSHLPPPSRPSFIPLLLQQHLFPNTLISSPHHSTRFYHFLPLLASLSHASHPSLPLLTPSSTIPSSANISSPSKTPFLSLSSLLILFQNILIPSPRYLSALSPLPSPPPTLLPDPSPPFATPSSSLILSPFHNPFVQSLSNPLTAPRISPAPQYPLPQPHSPFPPSTADSPRRAIEVTSGLQVQLRLR
ncbi:hypothetical protein C7M84_008905 [Penaeus vannamei]|uniref:Uncharacterized protein n=1 Tax=Penaeus vannamei TaxID=6689 RepID=A0A423T8B3_PENVA|nr:hypothetical protein C7M84_008905 [Penaeus vannamei]